MIFSGNTSRKGAKALRGIRAYLFVEPLRLCVSARVILALILLVVAVGLYAQDFGFGFDDDAEEAASSSRVSVKVGGEVAAYFLGYVHDFSSVEKAKKSSLGDIFSGALNFSASGANVDAFIALNLSTASINSLVNAGSAGQIYTPLFLDEAYLRSYFGPVSIEAGLRKLTWGKADSLGPLDVINPLDYSDLTNITDIQAMKIARPLIRVSWNMDGFSKLEAVFIPTFAGHHFAQDWRWAPSQYSTMTELAAAGILDRAIQLFPLQATIIQGMYPQAAAGFSGFSAELPDTSRLGYFQTGLRYTTTIGPADIGAQYFFGNLFRPDFTIAGVDAFLEDLISKNNPPNPANPYLGDPSLLDPQLKYSRYHQIGIDYALVLFGFNLRGEFAVNLTKDMKGDDGSVRNPFIGWSIGFDREIYWGISANVQCNETIRLMNKKVGTNPVLDSEAGTNASFTRITMQLSKKFFKDDLECKLTGIWGVEDKDCYIIPAIIWNIKDITTELSAGIFGGKESGELGQYWENSFIKLGLKYSF